MFGIVWSNFYTAVEFSSLESNAIFIDLSFFTVTTTGDTKQSLSMCFTFSKCPVFSRRILVENVPDSHSG